MVISMKHIVMILICALLFLTGCAAQNGENDDTPADSGEAETELIPGRQDREIIDDYKTAIPEGEHDASILFMNAGKADSILVTVDGKNYLIDTGTAASVPVINAALDEFGVTTLDGIFITHTDNDHTGGLESILSKYTMETIYTSAISADLNKVENLRGDAERVMLDPGAAVKITDGVYFTVMGPVRYNPADDNNNSLVLKLEVNGVSVLFAGDMMYDEETSLIHSEMPLDCDILKVGYHGNKEATSEKFAAKTSPELAVISTDREEDDNSAHKSVVTMLGTVGADVCVTDEYDLGLYVTIGRDGTITKENLGTFREPYDLKFTEVSKEDQYVVIENRESEDIDVSGWTIVSIRGREMFVFPEGSVVEAGASVTVACREYNGEHDYVWEDNRVWHKDKKDLAVLYDTWGNRVDEKKSK